MKTGDFTGYGMKRHVPLSKKVAGTTMISSKELRDIINEDKRFIPAYILLADIYKQTDKPNEAGGSTEGATIRPVISYSSPRWKTSTLTGGTRE